MGIFGDLFGKKEKPRTDFSNVRTGGSSTAPTPVLLAIDCWEHAYFLDYSLRKNEYVEGVLSHLDWAVVQERLDRGLLASVS